MFNAIVLCEPDQTEDFLKLSKELETNGLQPIKAHANNLESIIKDLHFTGATLFYSTPKIRIDLPAECCSWLNRNRAEFSSITAGKETVCIIPEESFVIGGKLCVRKAYHDTVIRAQEKTDGYLAYTGERVVPEAPAARNNMEEHLKMYALWYEIVKNKNVLDIACGCGYGSFELSKRAKNVFGADISEEAVNYASSHYNAPNLQFFVASATDFSLGVFDVITSIETFEHVREVENFIFYVETSLAPGGLFCFSTPNGDKLPFDSNGKIVGFHVKHYNKQELTLLCSNFKKVVIDELDNMYIVSCQKH